MDEGKDRQGPDEMEKMPGGARQGILKKILKRVLIAVFLLVTCVAILTVQKAYGVWVLTGIAVVLVVFGFLKKEKPPDEDGRKRGPP